MSDIFKLFKNSVETVRVKVQPRGTFEQSTPTSIVSIDAIVKRRKGFTEEQAEAEDYSNATSIHFKQEDAEHIKIGNFVEIDDEWHSIITLRDGKDFDRGVSKFPYAIIGDDIVPDTEEPVWGASA